MYEQRDNMNLQLRKPTYTDDDDDDQTSGITEQPDITEHRVISINAPQKQKFCSNRISTAKYNFFSFLPKFLFEQFRRYSNIFFLFIALLQQIPNVSPTGRYTTAVPLIFILTVSAIKEIIEDIKRHRADDAVNKSKVLALRNGQWSLIRWAKVAIGDIIKVTNGQFFPADLVLLSSSEPNAMCYIETSNLDGETNLKMRQGLTQTCKLLTTKDVQQLVGIVECELPNRHLYEFTGNLRLMGKQANPLGPDQILLRGARLRNTNWIFGVVIYTGHETKLMMNSMSAPLKRSTVDKITNNQILMLFLLLIVLCLVSAIASEIWTKEHSTTDWYLGMDELSTTNFGYTFLTFIILYNNLIPISLQVTLEVVRFAQAIFINMDNNMYYEETDTPAMARTSNLNEELGQVKYIFSDKTGTLTCNIMEFKRCSIAGVMYGGTEKFDKSVILKSIRENHPTAPYIKEFFTLMAVCHTVVPELDQRTHEICYQAASPDEGALVKGAKDCGFIFTTRTPEYVMINAMGTEQQFEVLNVLEFTSNRKRMSVIIRDQNGKIKLYCKGADTVIYERMKENQPYRETTLQHLKEFATCGLRTLCCAVSEVSEEFYQDNNMYYEETDTPAMARTSNLNEELGQVKYIFSDKTGTLTFHNLIKPTAPYIKEFFTLMAVCHTVVPELDQRTHEICYQAASPDEGALVKGAKDCGFIFTTRTPEYVMINAMGTEQQFEVLNVLEFTSNRKRMSVIIRDQNGKIKLYCKGADTVIYERMKENQPYRETTLQHLKEFATCGLRTLCCAVSEVSEEFYQEWKHTYFKASTSMQYREQKIEDAAQLIETGVPEAINDLLKADIRVWVLTGDKQETAINIGTEKFDKSVILKSIRENHPTAPYIKEFFTLMAVCHTVVPELDQRTHEICYQAASPDEGALVKGAKDCGFIFTTRTPEYVMINAMGTEQQFEVLNVLEFTSNRKRMSVIIRDQNGKIKLYCKGADTVIYERMKENQPYRETTLQHLKEFATCGLRTLCCAVSEVSEEFYQEWKHTYFKASTSMQYREQKIEDAAQLIETNLILLGATAIEDRLQEGVPEAINDLLKADIRVWVLTGDKQETAINIGYSCRLLNQGMPLLVINEDSLDNTREAIRRHTLEFGELLRKENDVALVTDGKTLKYALTSDVRHDFVDIALSCKSVICCRVSPMQKAEVVEMVKASTKSVTLAIGDGANDVAMIQAAHVGIGISGVEGLQAACASDYAIAQFRFLIPLLFVHGAWSHARLCKLILYSFHKNICLYVIELWWAILSGWSGQTLFERWSIGLYNVIFTAAPPVVMGLFDRTCSAETMMKFPALYKPSQSAQYFNVKVFWIWIVNSIFHSVLLYWLTYLSMTQDIAWSNGKEGGYLVLGNMIYTYVVVAVCLKAGLEMNAWTWVTHLAIWGSIASWFLFLLIYSNFWPSLPIAADMVGIDRMVMSSGVFWMGLIIIPLITLLGDFTYKVIHRTAFKTLAEAVRESEIANTDPGKVILHATKQRLTETARLLKNVFRRPSTHVSQVPLEMELQQYGIHKHDETQIFSTRLYSTEEHGYAFSQEEHGVVPQMGTCLFLCNNDAFTIP
ncbi:probable phospholipid-transporting ATPase IA [Centruroides sculpturatus]|uniref:probable phospholipid-transporting ATPase IA n=1 Tax=Centruroides sculpturatus TaxID=218467 RepID=UPI000C6CCAEA|nr:probable phospholipid-transporting ATPase IA [Centruroides sculpturatus]